ncbi:MAG: glycosyltransferase [Paludibacteraceae bacterium]
MDLFGIYFSLAELGLLAILLIALFIQFYFYIRYFMGIIRQNKRVESGEIEFLKDQPPVSVVICSRDEEENLRQFLPFVLEQDYPDYEVIVVNDGSTDGTEDYLSLLVKQSGKLRTTFVPAEATNYSTKKLGLTLGIKAAKNDLIIFTDADCMPEGKNWLAMMVRNFTPSAEFVLGYGGYLPKKGFLNKLIKYDTLFIAIKYLGMAVAHRPFMGVGRNLAYRKETFFKMKGFATTLNLLSGDNDLMVNRGGTGENTAIEVSPESVTWTEPKTSFRSWFIQKESHLSISERYNNESKRRLFIEVFSRGIFYLAAILLIVFSVLNFNWILLGIAVLFLLIRFVLQMYVINKSAKTLGEQKFYLTILCFDIVLPLISLFILVFGKKKKNGKRK